jgi:hypothetical protein
MKIETKRKILHWVKAVLHYYEYKDSCANFIVLEKHKIQTVRSNHSYHNRELAMISEDQVHFAAGMNMLTVLEANNFITYERLKDVNPDCTRVVATLKVVTP